jgi:citronellol/citronellal dehydrogenase
MSATPARYKSVFAADLFAERTIIDTGGGSGIGRCIAHELASLGAAVVLVGRTLEKLQKVAAEIFEDGGRASPYAFDIRDDEAVAHGIAEIVANHGAVVGLVNNAGGQYRSDIRDMSGPTI